MAKEFIAEDGTVITDELLEQMAEPWERGEVSGVAAGFVAGPGRPRIGDEETRLVAFRLPVSVLQALDRKAEQHGENRSQRLRNAVVADVLRA